MPWNKDKLPSFKWSNGDTEALDAELSKIDHNRSTKGIRSKKKPEEEGK